MVVQGNPRVYKALRNQMADIYEELKRLERCSEANDELLYTIQLIAETMNGLKGECPLLAESSSHFPSENKEDTERKKKKKRLLRFHLLAQMGSSHHVKLTRKV